MQEEHRGRIVRLEVNSFKSYRGHNTIGPFRCAGRALGGRRGCCRGVRSPAAPCPATCLLLQPCRPFTTIIGPNGSGKSNVMDSISFVLGVRTAQLRGSLKELLYHNTAGQSAEDRCGRPKRHSLRCSHAAQASTARLPWRQVRAHAGCMAARQHGRMSALAGGVAFCGSAADRTLSRPFLQRRPRKGSVKLVFEAPDGEEVHFERVIKPTGAGADTFTSEVRVIRRPELSWAPLPHACKHVSNILGPAAQSGCTVCG
jgi:hypothetical protein